jgi:hypothetical protein
MGFRVQIEKRGQAFGLDWDSLLHYLRMDEEPSIVGDEADEVDLFDMIGTISLPSWCLKLAIALSK